jgi:BlaI family penicillinase repressor
MPRKASDVPEAELAVLQVLWDRGPAIVRQITDILYPDGKVAHYATVQKLLDRLEAKKYVRRNRKVWPHVFEAAIERGDLIRGRLQKTADQLCDGSLQPLLTHLVHGAKLSRQERESLRVLLDELDQETGRPKK